MSSLRTVACLFLLLAASCLMRAQDRTQTDAMPVIAYWGVPEPATNALHFRYFSECGFTVSLYPYSSLDNLVKACRQAQQYGVRIIGNCPEMQKSPVRVASALKKERGFLGYFVSDEPSAPEIEKQQALIHRLRTADSTHLFYINLFPYSDPKNILHSVKTDYPRYLKAASATPCQQISFDHYPITTKGISPTWYHNLEMVRKESLTSGKPFWGFVLSVPHDVPFSAGNYYPTPTMASLRLQIYSNLAYGAQAVQYFTYWTPDGSNSFHFHDAPISQDGRKTKTYALVQQMNRELKSVSKLFYGAKVTDVSHLVVIPEGASRLSTAPVNLQSLKVIGRQGAVVSQLEKDGHQYLAIVNKSLKKTITVRIRTRNTTPRHLTKTLKEEPMKSSYSVEAGDILLFRLK